MPLFEVEVRRRSTVYFEVEAKSAAEAQANYKSGVQSAEFIEDEVVADVNDYDDRFGDDDVDEALTDVYEEEQFEYDE